MYSKMTINKDINKLAYGYDKFIWSEVKVQKKPGVPVTTIYKSKLKYPTDVDKYSLFVGQIMWYNAKVLPDVDNATREMAIHMSHTKQ